MNLQKTPLQIFVELLAGEEVPEDATALRALARQHAYSKGRRAREIAEYLIAAADERLPREKKAGWSLKRVLWGLRDIAGDLYESAVRDVLKFLLAHPDVPLTNVLPRIRNLSVAGTFYSHLAEAQDWSALVKYLRNFQVGTLRVAVNTTSRNLTDVAMRMGYDVMVAQSEKGTVVKARRVLRVDSGRLPGTGWKQVYSDLVIWRADAGQPPTVEDILAALPEAVSE